MARDKLPGRKLEVIEHPNGTSTELRFDAKSMEFWATVGPDTKTSKNGEEVRQWAKRMLGKHATMEWVPTIEITIHDRSHYGNGDRELEVDFHIEVERYWLGQTPGGKILKLEWEQGNKESPGYLEDAEEQFAAARDFRFDGHTRYRRSDRELPPEKLRFPRIEGSSHFLAWTPELWLGVEQMIDAAKAIDKTIRGLLATKTGHAEIERVGRERIPLQLTATATSTE